MTTDSYDPRMNKILQLISELTDHHGIANDATYNAPGDDIDSIIESLTRIAEQSERRRQSQEQIEARLNNLLQTIESIASLDFTHITQIKSKDDIFDAIAVGLNTIFEKLQASTVSRNYLYNIMASMPDSMIITDRDSRITMVNEAACRLLDYQESELRGQAVNDLVVEQFDGEAAGFHSPQERTFVARDGRHIPVACSVSKLQNDQGEVEGYLYFAQDITERRNMERDLLLTQFCVDHASVGIMRTGSDAQILSVNQKYCQMLGYTAQELCNLHVYDIDSNFPLERWKQHRGHIRNQGSDVFETVHRRKDGTTFPVEISTTYVPFQGDEFSFSFIRDITGRKQMLEALRLNNFAIERASDAVYWINADTIITNVNEAACHMLGYSYEEFIGMSVDAIDPIMTLDQVKEIWESIKQEKTLTFETQHKTKDGRFLSVEVMANHIAFEGKELNCAFVRDITERKQAEAALKMSQALLNESQAFAHIGSWSMDIQTGQLTWTDETFRLFGFQPQEVQPSFDLLMSRIHSTDQPVLRAHFQETMATKVFHPLRYRVVLPDGAIRWILNTGTTADDDTGKPIKFFGIVQDITERKQTEETLLDSENRFLVSFNESADLQAISRVEQDGTFRLVAVNNRYRETIEPSLGVLEQDIIGESLLIVMRDIFGFDESVCNYTLDNYQSVVNSGQVLRYEEAFDLSSGCFYFESVLAPIFASSNTCRYILYSAHDITERKLAQQALQVSEERLRQAVRVGNIGIFDHDQINDIIYVSSEHRNIYGFGPDETITLETFFKQVHPDDREEIIQAVQRAHDPAGDGSFVVENRIIDRSGTVRWLNTRSHTFFEGEGIARRPVRTIGAVADITERKLAEEALRESEARYRLIVETAQEGIWLVDSQGNTTYVNPKMAKMLGYTTDEMLLHSMYDFMDDAGRLEAQQNLERRRQGVEEQHEFRLKHKSGQDVWTSMATNPIVDDQGQFVAALAMVTDITERKQAADMLWQSRQMLQLVLDHIPSAVLWKDRNSVILGCNRQEAIMAGSQTAQDVVGLTDYDIPNVSPESAALFQQVDQRVMNSNVPELNFEELVLSPDGLPRWQKTSKVPLHDVTGQVIGVLVVTDDITERKQAEIALQVSEERLRQAVRAGNIGIFDQNHVNGNIYWSPEQRRIWGFDPDEIVTLESIARAMHPEDFESVVASAERSYNPEGDGSFDIEHRIIDRSGNIRWLSVRSQTIFEGEGSRRHHIRTVGAVADVSDYKKIEESLYLTTFAIERASDASITTDADLNILRANSAFNRLMGQNVVGQALTSFWHKEDLPLLNSMIDWVGIGGFFSAYRLNGFRSILDLYPDIEIVGVLAADWDRDKGRQMAEEFLKIYPPGTLDVIWAASSEMALGAVMAIQAAGRQEEVAVFSNDVTPESVSLIREGHLIAETYHGLPEWGWYGTQFAIRLVLGQEVPPKFDIRPRTIYKANADLVYNLSNLEPIDWESIKNNQELPDKIVIGWIQSTEAAPFKAATDFFEHAVADARANGINAEVITRIPATNNVADQAAIIEDYIQNAVDVIVLSTIAVDAVKRAIRKANDAGVPVIIVNQLNPIEGVEIASYIGIDNTVAGVISGYTVVDYLGGSGVLGEGKRIEVDPGTELDLHWWQGLYKSAELQKLDVKGRVAIIEGISGSWQGESRLVRSDGHVVSVDTTAYPMYDKKSHFSGLVLSLRDATERKQMENALRKSEERYRRLIESQVDLISRYRPDTILTFVNDAYCQFYGKTREELIGQSYLTMVAPEFHELTIKEAENMVKDPRPISGEYLNYSADGKEHWIQWIIQGIVDENDQVVELQAVGRDVTRLKETEAALQASEERLRLSASVGSIGIFDHDHHTNVIYWSPELRAIYGVGPDESVSVEQGRDHVYPEDSERIDRAAQRAWDPAGDGRFDVEYRIIDHGGTIRWISTRSRTLFEGEGDTRRPVRTVGAVMDLTERKQAEIALQVSENRLRIVMENLPIMVDALDEKFNFVVWNKECERVTGYRADEIIGNPDALQLLYPEQTQLDQMMANFAELGGEFRNQEWALTSKDGVKKIISWSNVSEQFPVPGWQTWAVGVDVTERRRAEEALREREARLRRAESMISMGHYSSNADSNILVVSDGIKRIWGYDLDFDPTYEDTLARIHPDDFDRVMAVFIKSAQEKSGFDIEYRVVRPDTSVAMVHTVAEVTFNEKSQQYVTFGTLIDITERKRAEEAIHKLNEELEQRVIERTQELEEANKEIRHFAYIVSHDLRAPLVNLKGFSGELRSAIKVVKDGCDEIMEFLSPARQAMMQQAIKEDIPEALQFIESSVDNMDSFTKAILKLSRLGRLQLEPVEVNTRAIVEDTLKSLAYQIDQRNVKITIGHLPLIVADLVSMEQIFGNILSNAVAYLVSDRPGEIEITAEDTANETIFHIRDNGRGIVKEDMDKVFAPFRRAGKQDIPGEGMGLAYVQTLVRRHGGRIWCDSEAGTGTTFTFTIPRNLTNDSALL